MNTTTETLQHQPGRETTLKVAAGGSMMETIGALATIALAIVGLAGVFSNTMAAIATIIIGAAILLESGSFAAVAPTRAFGGTRSAEAGSGVSAQMLGGLAGIVLGILALLGVSQPTLVSVAVLVYGGTFLLSSLALGQAWMSNSFEAASASAGGHIMVGLAGVVLGILAVIGLDQFVLVLVALLCLGAGALFSGAALGYKSISSVQQRPSP